MSSIYACVHNLIFYIFMCMLVSIGSGHGFVLSNSKPLPDPMLTIILDIIWHYQASMRSLQYQLDESTARRQLKSPRSLSGRSMHLTLVIKWSWSWSWMTYCHPLCAMSIGPPILRYSYFKIWPWKSMVKVMCVVKGQGHVWPLKFNGQGHDRGHIWGLGEREREIKFIGLFENRGHRGPYSPYKPFNHNLYIGIIIFPHIDNPQYTGYDLPKKKPNKIINAKKVRAPLIWQIIGEKDSGSVYMWI